MKPQIPKNHEKMKKNDKHQVAKRKNFNSKNIFVNVFLSAISVSEIKFLFCERKI